MTIAVIPIAFLKTYHILVVFLNPQIFFFLSKVSFQITSQFRWT